MKVGRIHAVVRGMGERGGGRSIKDEGLRYQEIWGRDHWEAPYITGTSPPSPSLAAPPDLLGAGDALPVGVSEPSLPSRIQRAQSNAWLAAPNSSRLGAWAPRRLESLSSTVLMVVLESCGGGGGGGGPGNIWRLPMISSPNFLIS